MNTQNTDIVRRDAFLLPDVVSGGDFTAEELAEDMDGLNLGFPRVKIPSGGMLQFELPGDDPDNPDYARNLEGVIVYQHNANAYWPDGADSDENTPPACQSSDGKLGQGDPGGLCGSCPCNAFGSGPNGRGKACKNSRVLYLLRSGDFMPIQITLPPTSIKPFTDFVNAAFLQRKRGVCGGVVQIGLKKMNNGKDDYSVATFRKLYDFTGEELRRVKAFAEDFKQQVQLILRQQAANRETNAHTGVEVARPVKAMPDNAGNFVPVTDGDDGLPL